MEKALKWFDHLDRHGTSVTLSILNLTDGMVYEIMQLRQEHMRFEYNDAGSYYDFSVFLKHRVYDILTTASAKAWWSCLSHDQVISFIYTAGCMFSRSQDSRTWAVIPRTEPEARYASDTAPRTPGPCKDFPWRRTLS